MSEEIDSYWMMRAIDLSYLCPPSESAYSVGAIIIGRDGEEISTGYSRETESHIHAEESVLAKLDDRDPRLAHATLYSTLEPCSHRSWRSSPCAERILASGLRRVVIAWREPELFVDCKGVELLTAGGVAVVELVELAELARAANSHLACGEVLPRQDQGE